MDDFSLNSKHKRYRKRKDIFKNTILEFVAHQPSVDQQIHFLNFSGEKLGKPRFDFKKEANLLVRRLAKQGFFHVFPVREQKNAELHGKLPHGYQVDFIIPPAVGGRYAEDNLYVVAKEASLLMYQLYWRQVIPELKAFIHKNESHRIAVQMPIIPKLFSREDFLNFVPNYERQEIEKYLERKEKWRQNALKHVVARSGKRTLVLQLQNRKKVPTGMRYALVKTTSLSALERARLRQEYLHKRQGMVCASLERRDFSHLSKKIQDIISKTGHVPEEADLTCHHILPRSLGGENSVENICWLGKNDHMRLHRTYIDPLIEYLDSAFDEKRVVFVEIPVPIDTKMPLFVFSKQGLVVQEEREEKKDKTFLKKVVQRVGKHKNR